MGVILQQCQNRNRKGFKSNFMTSGRSACQGYVVNVPIMVVYRSCMLGTTPGTGVFFGTRLSNHIFAKERVGTIALCFDLRTVHQ